MRCPSCGAKLHAGTSFCALCGTELRAWNAGSPPSTYPPPGQPARPTGPVASSPAPYRPPPAAYSPGGGPRVTFTPAAWVIGGVVLFLLAFGITVMVAGGRSAPARSGSTFDPGTLADQLEDEIYDRYSQEVQVTCPADTPMQAGTSFECTTDDGSTVRIDVTSDTGDFDWAFD